MAEMILTPTPAVIADDVGDTQSILVSVDDNGVPVDLTLWTVTGLVLDRQAGTTVATYTVSSGATRTLSLSAAQTTALGAGTSLISAALPSTGTPAPILRQSGCDCGYVKESAAGGNTGWVAK